MEQLSFEFMNDPEITYTMYCVNCGGTVSSSQFAKHAALCSSWPSGYVSDSADASTKPRDIIAERAKQYGDPLTNLGCAASLIGQYLDITLAASDVAIIMCLLKVARIATGPGYVEDNYRDLRGYAELAESLAARTKGGEDDNDGIDD